MEGINHKIKNVLNLSSEEKYNYFISKVTDFEEIWGLYKDGWALLGKGTEKLVFPFWPEKEFASLNVFNEWNGYEPKIIKLDDFLEKWIPGLISDNIEISIFYHTDSNDILVSAEKLAKDIKLELEQYL